MTRLKLLLHATLNRSDSTAHGHDRTKLFLISHLQNDKLSGFYEFSTVVSTVRGPLSPTDHGEPHCLRLCFSASAHPKWLLHARAFLPHLVLIQKARAHGVYAQVALLRRLGEGIRGIRQLR